MKFIKKENCIVSFILLIVSSMFVFVFSTSTSPIIPHYYYWDSAIFQVVGKSWERGILPYAQCFDHKGPLLFLIEAIGYSFGIDKVGVAIVQCIFLSISMFFVYKILRLFVNKNFSMLFTLLTYVVLVTSYDGGNYSEEYSLLFINSSIYLVLKYFMEMKNGNDDHPFMYALWYGISFASMTMMRMTNALSVCCIVFVVSIVLFSKKKIKNFFMNVIFFMVGLIVVFLPFILYFYSNEALEDMFFGTIVYNFLYLTDSTIELNVSTFLSSFISFVMIITSVLHLCVKGKKDIVGMFAFLYGVLSTILFFMMNGYAHYQMIVIVFFPIIIGMTVDLWREKDKVKYAKFFCYMCVFMIMLQCTIGGYGIIKQKRNLYVCKHYTQDYLEMSECFNSYIPDEEKGKVLTFGYYNLNQWYLVNDQNPPFKYFILQDWQTSHCDSMTGEIIEYLQSGDAKWIITEANEDASMSILFNKKYKSVIESNYNLVKNYNCDRFNFNLYALK